jgi:hypothetical protein
MSWKCEACGNYNADDVPTCLGADGNCSGRNTYGLAPEYVEAYDVRDAALRAAGMTNGCISLGTFAKGWLQQERDLIVMFVKVAREGQRARAGAELPAWCALARKMLSARTGSSRASDAPDEHLREHVEREHAFLLSEWHALQKVRAALNLWGSWARTLLTVHHPLEMICTTPSTDSELRTAIGALIASLKPKTQAPEHFKLFWGGRKSGKVHYARAEAFVWMLARVGHAALRKVHLRNGLLESDVLTFDALTPLQRKAVVAMTRAICHEYQRRTEGTP